MCVCARFETTTIANICFGTHFFFFLFTNQQGSIVRTNTKDACATYTITGNIEAVDDSTLRITELPIRRWTEEYKKVLDTLEEENFIEVADYT